MFCHSMKHTVKKRKPYKIFPVFPFLLDFSIIHLHTCKFYQNPPGQVLPRGILIGFAAPAPFVSGLKESFAFVGKGYFAFPLFGARSSDTAPHAWYESALPSQPPEPRYRAWRRRRWIPGCAGPPIRGWPAQNRTPTDKKQSYHSSGKFRKCPATPQYCAKSATSMSPCTACGGSPNRSISSSVTSIASSSF